MRAFRMVLGGMTGVMIAVLMALGMGTLAIAGQTDQKNVSAKDVLMDTAIDTKVGLGYTSPAYSILSMAPMQTVLIKTSVTKVATGRDETAMLYGEHARVSFGHVRLMYAICYRADEKVNVAWHKLTGRHLDVMASGRECASQSADHKRLIET